MRLIHQTKRSAYNEEAQASVPTLFSLAPAAGNEQTLPGAVPPETMEYVVTGQVPEVNDASRPTL